jgi:hypothetical protein
MAEDVRADAGVRAELFASLEAATVFVTIRRATKLSRSSAFLYISGTLHCSNAHFNLRAQFRDGIL